MLRKWLKTRKYLFFNYVIYELPEDNFKEDIIASMNKTDGILDYLYTRIVELMVCVNGLDEMKNKFCLPPRITPRGLEILPEPEFKLKVARKLTTRNPTTPYDSECSRLGCK